ncbi:NYN domain-containing protein [Candidatus Kuenenbacteria bacterium]|nr:NYN domain-containing protein [Candidatus Kuenenbacteria bacterium]
MSIYKEQRVGVLVDIQNLYYSAKVLYGRKVNFGAILKESVGDRKLIRAIAYGIKTMEGLEKNFFEALEKVGYDVKTKDLQIFPGGAKKGDWDVGIAMDAVKLSQSVDVIILVSGDGDYIPLVEYIQNTTGCRVEVVAFAESASAKLMEAVDSFTNMSENKRKFLIANMSRGRK